MRKIARQKLGYFPLPSKEAERMRRFLVFSGQGTSVLDPCAGTGAALATITAGANVIPYAIELDAYRAEEAAKSIEHVVHGDCFDVHCQVESFSGLFLNPPYDWEVSEGRNARMEYLFLKHTYRWLKSGGVLVFVIPGERLGACSEILAVHFRDKAIYKLSEPEAVRYKQVVVFGVRRTRREREQLRDGDVSAAKAKLLGLARNYDELPVLPDLADRQFMVPPSGPAQLVYRGIALDSLEEMLPGSAAYRQAARILFAPEVQATGQPLTPLHGGHIGLLTTSSLVNGIFGEGDDLHVAFWQSAKLTDTFEETDDDGVITIRERQRFTQSLTLVYADGRTAVLDDRRESSEECASANGNTPVRKDHAEHDDGYHGVDGPHGGRA
jgi:16S rRNA G966 N2-methylase RsmD